MSDKQQITPCSLSHAVYCLAHENKMIRSLYLKFDQPLTSGQLKKHINLGKWLFAADSAQVMLSQACPKEPEGYVNKHFLEGKS